jgi:cytoskeletal protein CcmA (bactofilin family)
MLWRKRGNTLESKEEVIAFLGKGTEFKGKLTFNGTVRIDGNFSGEIFAKGSLIFGESSQIRAEIEANKVIISGEVNGNIKAASRVEIHSPGKIHGNIKSPVLVIDEGVIFEGSCQMEAREEKNLSVLSVEERKKGWQK